MNDRGRPSRSHPGFWGSRRCPLSTNCSISQPFAFGADQGAIGPHLVVNTQFDAVEVTEIELSQIPLQVSLGNMEVAAIDAALRIEKKPSTVLV
jgi:hypothetical protein